MRTTPFVVLLLGLACATACGKTSGPPDREVTVVAVPAASAVLPGVGLAAPTDEDTVSEIAEVAGDNPIMPRCTGVRIELATKKTAGDRVKLVATIVNAGPRAVTLVEPGDGSESGWRSPIITWKVTTPDGKRVAPEDGSRCGNVNDIEEKEIFTLAPGARRRLGESLGEPNVVPGHYVVRLVYDNDPSRGLRGLSGGASEPALKLIRKSTPCKVESGAVVTDISGY